MRLEQEGRSIENALQAEDALAQALKDRVGVLAEQVCVCVCFTS